MDNENKSIYYGVTPLKETDKNKVIDTKTFKCPFCGSEMNYIDFNASPNLIKPYQEVVMPWQREFGITMGRPAWKEEFECSLKCSNCEIIISNIKFEHMYWEDASEKKKSAEEPKQDDETNQED